MLTTVRVNNQIAHRKQLVAGISALPLSLTFLLATAYRLNSGIATSMHDDLPQSFLMVRQCTRRINTGCVLRKTQTVVVASWLHVMFHTSIVACSLLRLTPLYDEVAATLTIAAALAICVRSLTTNCPSPESQAPFAEVDLACETSTVHRSVTRTGPMELQWIVMLKLAHAVIQWFLVVECVKLV